MAPFGGRIDVPPTDLCDHCGKKPKSPPYDYCDKTCGSKANSTGSAVLSIPPLCKQCGQKPAYGSYQFCGRDCANAWQAIHGQINTMPPPPIQNSPNPTLPFQGFDQGGSSGIKRIFKSLKGLVSQNQQPQPPQSLQKKPGPLNPVRMQQGPGSISPNTPPISPPLRLRGEAGSIFSKMGSPIFSGTFDPPTGMVGMSAPTIGLDEQDYPSSFHTMSSEIQDPDADGQVDGWRRSPPPDQSSTTEGQPMFATMGLVTPPPMNSAGGESQPNDGPDSDPYPDWNEDPAVTSTHNPDVGKSPVNNQDAGGWKGMNELGKALKRLRAQPREAERR